MMNGLKIDLHMHSNVSDGTDTPPELLEKVRQSGIRLFALTDHDGIRGCGIIRDSLREGDPAFLCGAEFSCRDEEGKYHILGYNFDPAGASIRNVVETGHGLRMKKAAARLEYLESAFGFTFSREDAEKLLSLDNPGKPHIGNLMVKYGYAESKDQAIHEYMNCVRFPDAYIRPEQAIRGILESGGIPVLAHPAFGSGENMIVGKEMDERLSRLKGFGLDFGILKEIVVLAIPIIIVGVILTFLGIIITYSLELYASPIAVFTYIIILNVQSTVFTPIQGIMKALCIVSGHLNGAERYIELRNTIRKVFSISLGLGILIALVLAIFHNPIIGIFSTENVVLDEVRNILYFVVIYIISFPIIMGCSYVFLGIEKSTYTLMFLVLNILTLIFFIGLFNHFLGLSSAGVYLSIILSNAIEAVGMLVVLKRFFDSKISTSRMENESDIHIGN